jgi:membrane protease YdiL (CAAX protease family)
VRLFNDVSRQGDFTTVFLIVVAGVIVAPICEEVLFRGYFYPVAKRYMGPGAGAFVTAALFAVSHVNLASLPALLVLALCFIVAYERTGSLLVPISMHAFFNGANLLVLYLVSQAKG